MLGYSFAMRSLILSLVLISPIAVGGVYKWVDETGEVHYSDKPVQNARELRVPGAVSKPVPQVDAEAEQDDLVQDVEAGGYNTLEFASPEPGQTFRSDAGEVQIGLLLDPPLQPGHQLQLVIDGAPLSQRFSATQLILKDVSRGTHSMKAEIVDQEGQSVASSTAVSFHVRKAAMPGSTP